MELELEQIIPSGHGGVHVADEIRVSAGGRNKNGTKIYFRVILGESLIHASINQAYATIFLLKGVKNKLLIKIYPDKIQHALTVRSLKDTKKGNALGYEMSFSVPESSLTEEFLSTYIDARNNKKHGGMKARVASRICEYEIRGDGSILIDFNKKEQL